MPIAVSTDIHGNSVALDAVIDDAAAAGAARWWLLGDLVAMGPDPAGTIARLRRLDPEVRVLGNTERYVLNDELPFPPSRELELTPGLVDQMLETAASMAWTKGSLSVGDRSWLSRGTTNHHGRLGDGTEVLAVHASALRDDGPGVSPDRNDDELGVLFPGVVGGLVLGGHTHHVTDRTVAGVRFVNPGSVSNNTTNHRLARYLLIHDDPSGHELEFRCVPDDVEAAVDQIVHSGLPGAGFLLREYFGR